jgi:hypothetical protein
VELAEALGNADQYGITLVSMKNDCNQIALGEG